eukprot:CAMPEP_0181107184 /NCGR_PEP_ID=MMETSP1071-20121207/16942_1 /TAXON_ID=35127 /ORGANISM="Thalassiosira sp., Strain NH16" /LENGTH=448 /DNA_ID=CAMNT_0023190665 /DNA_START=186 /DNA_END=1528 /DNA_ORIENTATION=+
MVQATNLFALAAIGSSIVMVHGAKGKETRTTMERRRLGHKKHDKGKNKAAEKKKKQQPPPPPQLRRPAPDDGRSPPMKQAAFVKGARFHVPSPTPPTPPSSTTTSPTPPTLMSSNIELMTAMGSGYVDKTFPIYDTLIPDEEETQDDDNQKGYSKNDDGSRSYYSKNDNDNDNDSSYGGSNNNNNDSKNKQPYANNYNKSAQNYKDNQSHIPSKTCLTMAQCDAKRHKMGIISEHFYVDDYGEGHRGCFKKYDRVYWGTGGADADKASTDLSGVKERVWCGDDIDWWGDGHNNDKPTASPTMSPTMFPTMDDGWEGDGAKPDGWGKDGWEDDGHKVCGTRYACERQSKRMGFEYFYSDDYQTKGCFSKGYNAFWGGYGTAEERKTTDIPDLQTRIYCDDLNPTKSPSMSPTMFPTMSPEWKDDEWEKDGWEGDGNEPDGWESDGHDDP